MQWRGAGAAPVAMGTPIGDLHIVSRFTPARDQLDCDFALAEGELPEIKNSVVIPET
jgi:hypothetical protein